MRKLFYTHFPNYYPKRFDNWVNIKTKFWFNFNLKNNIKIQIIKNKEIQKEFFENLLLYLLVNFTTLFYSNVLYFKFRFVS